MFELEKGFTSGFRKKIKKSYPSDEIIKKIVDSIETETLKRKKSLNKNKKNLSIAKLYIYPIAAILILFLGYYFFSAIYSKNKDFVHQAHNIFTKIENNEVIIQHLNSNATELQEIMRSSAGFNVFIPELKDAILIGGSVNELNDAKVVHFIFRKNDKLIYTMQMDRNDLIGKDKLFLHKNHLQEISEGHNWIECEKNDSDCTVIWFKNDVICSSVSKLEAKEIAAVLTNYK